MTQNMTIEDIRRECAAIETAMVAKGFVTPECSLEIGHGDKATVTLKCGYSTGPRLRCGDSTHWMQHFFGDSIEDAFAKARARIASQQDPETEALHRYMRDLGKVVDEGRKDGVPDEYTQPVSLTIKAMSDNLLTHEVAE